MKECPEWVQNTMKPWVELWPCPSPGFGQGRVACKGCEVIAAAAAQAAFHPQLMVTVPCRSTAAVPWNTCSIGAFEHEHLGRKRAPHLGCVSGSHFSLATDKLGALQTLCTLLLLMHL